MAKNKGEKMSAEREAVIAGELSIKAKFHILHTLLQPRMKHIETIYVLEDGSHSFSEGNPLKVQRDLDPKNEHDAKIISLTGKKRGTVTLPGTYVNRKKVVDEIAVADFMEDKEEIVKAFNEELKVERENKKKLMAENPDATIEFLAETFSKAAKA